MLIDGDNAQPSLARQMIDQVSRFGLVTVRRIYGDWTTTNLNGWKKLLASCAIQPIQQFANTTGKNATDSAMIIDAMDTLHSGTVDGFCLVSSDGDYTRLAVRMREAGAFVMGIGNSTTPQAFVTACEVFVDTNHLRPLKFLKPAPPPTSTPNPRPAGPKTHATPPTKSGPAGAKTAVPPAAPPKKSTHADPPATVPSSAANRHAKLLPSEAIPLFDLAIQKSAQEDGWARLGTVGCHLREIEPSFDVRAYGLGRISSLVDHLSSEFATRTVALPGGNSELFVRRRNGSSRHSPAPAHCSRRDHDPSSSL